MKALVTYFSASGVTAKLARRLSDAINAPLYEIKPAVPYTEADLDWRNEQSRSTIEMQDKNCRPALADTNAPVAGADIIFVGYPVWWYREPSMEIAKAEVLAGKRFSTNVSADELKAWAENL